MKEYVQCITVMQAVTHCTRLCMTSSCYVACEGMEGYAMHSSRASCNTMHAIDSVCKIKLQSMHIVDSGCKMQYHVYAIALHPVNGNANHAVTGNSHSESC